MVDAGEQKNNAERISQILKQLGESGKQEVRDFAIKELHEIPRNSSENIRDAWISATILVLIKKGIL